MELRSILGSFLFRDEEVFKKIKVLSGGEKSRVALAKTLISEANFLLLDEPTNHLDIQSVNILIQALQQYQGSFVVVSHDRHFVTQIANKIWYIENHELKEYPGTYDEYVWWRSQQESKTKPDQPVKSKVKEGKKKDKPKDDGEQKRLKKELAILEDKIAELESSLETVEKELSDPNVYDDPDKANKITENHTNIKSELEKLHEEWEKMVDLIEE